MDPDLDLDPDPNWAKILDSDPNSMYLDPQHCCKVPGMFFFVKRIYNLSKGEAFGVIHFYVHDAAPMTCPGFKIILPKFLSIQRG